MFCHNCGNKVSENAVVCVKCGVALNRKPISPTINTSYQPVNKKPIGLGIASMVLGIVGAIFTLLTLIGIQTAFDQVIFYTTMGEVLGFAFGYVLIQSIFAITGLVLGLIEQRKSKNAFNKTGVILGIVTEAIVLLEFVLIIFY